VELVFKDGVAYNPKLLRDSLRDLSDGISYDITPRAA
jgi:hypothetical protein